MEWPECQHSSAWGKWSLSVRIFLRGGQSLPMTSQSMTPLIPRWAHTVSWKFLFGYQTSRNKQDSNSVHMNASIIYIFFIVELINHLLCFFLILPGLDVQRWDRLGDLDYPHLAISHHWGNRRLPENVITPRQHTLKESVQLPKLLRYPSLPKDWEFPEFVGPRFEGFYVARYESSMILNAYESSICIVVFNTPTPQDLLIPSRTSQS